MLNQCVLVGRFKEFKNNELTIAVSQSYKNAKGEYDVDMIKVIVEGSIASNVKEYCHKGNILGVKGRITSNNKIIVEKITFLSSKHSK